MSTEEIYDRTDGSDPAGLPVLLSAPAVRPGRQRGAFSMTAHTSLPRPAALDRLRKRQDAPSPTWEPVDLKAADAVVDWSQVAMFRTMVATRLAGALGGSWSGGDSDGERPGAGASRAEQQALGLDLIEEVLREHSADVAAAGEQSWTPAERTATRQAVFDAVFRLGRLQPLVDDDRVENIFLLGHDQVLLELTDGSRVPGARVADSDDELIDFLRFLANRSESNPRPFSESHPRLHMKLDGGARMAATAWVTSRPNVVIRRHRLKVDNLSGWVEREGLSPACANLLAAAIRAAWSVTVAGPMGAGKTTLVRALCAEIPREEAIGTFETEHELFLGETGNHDIVLDWEARPGVGEVGLNGRAAGAFELSDALTDSFRFNLSRQIVGEVRGPEAWTMIKAMESGTGSLSTTHAANAGACVRKLVTCAMEDGAHVTRDLAVEKLAGCLDLIVQLGKRVETLADGTQVLRRWVSEVVLVEPGEREIGYSLTHLFGPSSSGPARATGNLPPRVSDQLAEHGFDARLFMAEADSDGWAP